MIRWLCYKKNSTRQKTSKKIRYRRYITLSTAIASQIRAKRRERLQTTGNLVTDFSYKIFIIFLKNFRACLNMTSIPKVLVTVLDLRSNSSNYKFKKNCLQKTNANPSTPVVPIGSNSNRRQI